MSKLWSTYGKSLIAALMLIVTAVEAALSDDHVTQAEWLQIAIAVATAASVYLVPAVPSFPAAKTIVACVLGALEAAVTLIDNGISSADWTAIVLAALTAVTVGAAPAALHRVLPPAKTARAGADRMPTTVDLPVKDA